MKPLLGINAGSTAGTAFVVHALVSFSAMNGPDPVNRLSSLLSLAPPHALKTDYRAAIVTMQCRVALQLLLR